MIEQLEGQISIFDRDLQYGRTYPAPSQATRGTTSKPSSKPSAKSQTPMLQYLSLKKESGARLDASWATVTALPGVCMTLNTGESPSVARESTLSQILQANAPEKYYLSPKACAGILRRAERRGKELPTMLKEALEEVVYLNRVTDYTAITCFQNTGIGYWMEHKFAETLRTPCGGDSVKANLVVEKKRKYIVRRLTPLECCRLQGFPDWWEDGVEGSDSARYKMWGNGMALPNKLFVMQGIMRCKEMGNKRSSAKRNLKSGRRSLFSDFTRRIAKKECRCSAAASVRGSHLQSSLCRR